MVLLLMYTRDKNMKKFSLLFVLSLLILVSSCQTMAEYTLSNEKSVALVVEEENPVDFGNIVFTEKGTSIVSKLFWSLKKPSPSINEKTIQIEGCRTFSSSNSSIRTRSVDSTINSLIGIKQYDYEWTGKLIFDTNETAIWYHFWVAGSSRENKEYELDYDYCGGKKATLKDKLKIFEYYIPKDASILTMQSDINNFNKEIPLFVAKFRTNSDAEYYIYATRSKKYDVKNLANLSEEELEKWMPKITSKEIILDEEQVFQITNTNKDKLFAECSKDSYKIYSATDEETKRDIKECIGSFIAYLWAIDEHEKADRVLTADD